MNHLAIPRSKYYAPIRSGAVLGQLAARSLRNSADSDSCFDALSPKTWIEQADAIATKGFLDPVARALFVESFCRAASAEAWGEK